MNYNNQTDNKRPGRAFEIAIEQAASRYQGQLTKATGARPCDRGTEAQKAWTADLISLAYQHGHDKSSPVFYHSQLRTGVTNANTGGQCRFDQVMKLLNFAVFFEVKSSCYETSDNNQFKSQLIGFGNETGVTKEPAIFCKIFAKEKRIYLWTREDALVALRRGTLLPDVRPSPVWAVEWPIARRNV